MGTTLSDLKPAPGSRRARKRRGRGNASGQGGSAGRGTKGQKARSGGHIPRGFEGGQMPLSRRLPKRGFKNPFPKEVGIVNVRDLAGLAESVVDVEVLHRLGRVPRGIKTVKLLGEGEIERAVTVRLAAVSAGARQKIEAAGGSVELVA